MTETPGLDLLYVAARLRGQAANAAQPASADSRRFLYAAQVAQHHAGHVGGRDAALHELRATVRYLTRLADEIEQGEREP